MKSEVDNRYFWSVNSIALLSLGSNTNDPQRQLETAIAHLNSLTKISVTGISAKYSTPPWGKTDQPDFLNMAVTIQTTYNVVELMENILSIEEKMGRIREEKWGPRNIDVDIVLFDDIICRNDFVTVPHPHMESRRFVLQPASEIAGAMRHPVLNKTISELLAVCPDSSVVLPSE